MIPPPPQCVAAKISMFSFLLLFSTSASAQETGKLMNSIILLDGKQMTTSISHQ